MYYFKELDGDKLLSIETRDQPAVNPPASLVEITQAEYEQLYAQITGGGGD